MKKLRTLLCLALALVMVFALAACGEGGETTSGGFKVTFYDSDGTTVLAEVDVEDGGTVAEPELTKEGYVIEGYYATPALAIPFDMSAPIFASTIQKLRNPGLLDQWQIPQLSHQRLRVLHMVEPSGPELLPRDILEGEGDRDESLVLLQRAAYLPEILLVQRSALPELDVHHADRLRLEVVRRADRGEREGEPRVPLLAAERAREAVDLIGLDLVPERLVDGGECDCIHFPLPRLQGIDAHLLLLPLPHGHRDSQEDAGGQALCRAGHLHRGGHSHASGCGLPAAHGSAHAHPL